MLDNSYIGPTLEQKSGRRVMKTKNNFLHFENTHPGEYQCFYPYECSEASAIEYFVFTGNTRRDGDEAL